MQANEYRVTVKPDSDKKLKTEAYQIIEDLKKLYVGNRFLFDANVSQFVTGNHKKELRQVIILIATGEKKPKSDCTVLAVSNALKNKFDAPELF